MIVLRVARRRTTWETSPVDEIIKAEFRDRDSGEVDLSPSVYEVEETDVVRTVTEHCASFNATPRGFPNVDLSGQTFVATPGETRFQFTIQAHREMRFRDIAELRSYLEETIIPQFVQRRREVKLQDAKAYASRQREAGVLEWVQFFVDNPRWPP